MEQIRRGAVVFNPAPGWPESPPGWLPALDWKPPTAWPPAPDGWQFYLELPPDLDDDLTRQINASRPATDFHPAYTRVEKNSFTGYSVSSPESEGLALPKRWTTRIMVMFLIFGVFFVGFSVVQIMSTPTVPFAAATACTDRAWEEAAVTYPDAASNANPEANLSVIRSTVSLNTDGSATVNGYTTVSPEGTVLAWTCTAVYDKAGAWSTTGYESTVEAQPVAPISG